MSRPSRPSGRSAGHLRVADEWVGGRLQMPAYVMEDEPFRPHVALWLDATNDLVVGHEVIEPDAAPEVTADLLLRSFEHPMAGRPRRPARIRVADPKLAALVRERAGDIPVEVAPTPELDGVIGMFSEAMRLDKNDGSYLEGGKVAPETVARFFEAAAKLYRVAPWKHVYDAQLFYLDSPDLSMRQRCVSIIGNLGESFGLLIFDSVAAFDMMAERGEAMLAGEETSLGTTIFSINFDKGSDIPKRMRREVAEHHWEVVDANAYPNIQYVDHDRLLRPLTDHDLDCATACSAAIAAFFAKHAGALAQDTFTSAREHVVVDVLPGKPVVEVVAPHPGRQWSVDDEDDDEDEDEDEDADREAEAARGREVVAAFLAGQRQERRGDEWLDAAKFVVEDLYHFKVQYADGTADRWTAALVEEYLLDYFPRKVSADEELIALVPEIADVFFAWLTEAGRISARSGQAIRKRIAQKSKAFARNANDPASFGMAKSFVMAMKDAGVDISNRDQVNAFVGGFNARLPGKALLPGLPQSMAPAEWALEERAPSKARWMWSRQGAPPDPKAPCPCGSGKRYKKCCMPR